MIEALLILGIFAPLITPLAVCAWLLIDHLRVRDDRAHWHEQRRIERKLKRDLIEHKMNTPRYLRK